jgi:hypothetical protein
MMRILLDALKPMGISNYFNLLQRRAKIVRVRVRPLPQLKE